MYLWVRAFREARIQREVRVDPTEEYRLVSDRSLMRGEDRDYLYFGIFATG